MTWADREIKLVKPGAKAGRDALALWRQADPAAGPRRTTLEQPDDAVAYRLVEAADAAMTRGDWQRGVNILTLVIEDYGQSQEAAFARQVMDQLAKARSR